MTTTIEKSSNVVSAFEHETFGEIRALNRDGDFWFVAKYVCEALGLDNVGEALRGLDDDEKITITNPDGNPRAGIPHQFACISESGLYSLILRSRKPEAKAFKRWVTHEVLPAIRRDGGYIHTTKEDDDHTIMIKACRILKAANEKLEKQIAEAAPKAQLADDYLVEGEEISIGDLAKKLGYEGINIGPHRLFELLRNKGVLISRPGVQFNTPTQKYASRGWFKIIQPPSSMLGKWKKQIRVTPKGVMEISKRMHELYGSDL